MSWIQCWNANHSNVVFNSYVNLILVHVEQRMIALQVSILSKSILLLSVNGFFMHIAYFLYLKVFVCFFYVLYQLWLLCSAEWQKWDNCLSGLMARGCKWVHSLVTSKISNTNMLISQLKYVQYPTTSTPYLC
jgi:hypothetical protein